MIEAGAFLAALDDHGGGPYLGVPCSFLTPFINCAIGSPRQRYLAASNEGEAVAMAAGAYLAGRRPVVMFQNSGLGNAVNPLTSLAHPFRIPLLLIVTLRGEPGLDDEPQHELMGRVTENLLRSIEVPSAPFPDDPARIVPTVAEAFACMGRSGLPYALVMRKDSVAPHPLTVPPPAAARPGTVLGEAPSARTALELERAEAIARIAGALPAAAALIATTGHIGRELFAAAERPGNLYVVGSMGCAASIGLGIALEQPARPVVVLDGDGAALMRLEALASIGHYRPPGLVHLILDNQVHGSTGGQASLAATVDFAAVAAACGYADTQRIVVPSDLAPALARALATPGPHLLHVRVRPGHAPNLPRPTLTPVQVKERFMDFLAG